LEDIKVWLNKEAFYWRAGRWRREFSSAPARGAGRRNLGSARASRAGDRALVIANFSF